MAQVKTPTLLNHGPLRSGTGRSTIGPRPPPKFGTSSKKPNSRKIFQDAGSLSSLLSTPSTISPALPNSSTGTLDSTIRNLSLADKPTPRTPSPILESMGEPRTPPSEPILESMGDDGIMAPPALIHAPQPHYYNTVNGPLAYHAQHGAVSSWPNHGGYAPPADYGTVGSHHGHAFPHQQQQQGHYPQHPHQYHQHWPQDQFQQLPQQHQLQHLGHDYAQQQNIANAAAHGYQLVSNAPAPAPVVQQALMPTAAAMPSATAPFNHHSPIQHQMISPSVPAPPVDIPMYKSYFPPKTELDPSGEDDANPLTQPTPTQVTCPPPPQEQRQRPPSPRITIPSAHSPSSAPSSQTSARTSAHPATPATPASSLPSASSITQDKINNDKHSQSSSPLSSTSKSTPTLTSSVVKLGDRLANFTSNKTGNSSTSRLSEISTLGSVRAKSAKFNAMAAVPSESLAAEIPVTHTSSNTSPNKSQHSPPPSAPKSTSLSNTALASSTVVDIPSELPPTSPPETSSETSRLDKTTSIYSAPAKAASTTSLDSSSSGASGSAATTPVLTLPATEGRTTVSGPRPVPTKASSATGTNRRPVSTVGPPLSGGASASYDWRSEWAERRKSTPVSPYSPSFNALRKFNMEKELPPIRSEKGDQSTPPSRTASPKSDVSGRSGTPKADSVSGLSLASSPATAAAVRTTPSPTATPPVETTSHMGPSRTATPQIDNPPSPDQPFNSIQAAIAPMPVNLTGHLRAPTPPTSAIKEASSQPVTAAVLPQEERRAHNLSDYVYYDHDHDSKCIVDSTDAYPTSSVLTSTPTDDSGKVPLEHSTSSFTNTQDKSNNVTHKHGNSSKPLTAAESNFICAGCDEPISGMMVTAMSKRWHVDHFICVECGQNLEHVQFFQRDGRPYCHYDYHEKFSPRCAHCDTAIENECLTALGKSWHPEHFFCRSCGDPFGEDGYMIHEDRPYCEKDYLRLFAPKCAGCQDPIQGDFINALKRKWHRDCFGCMVCHIGFDNSSYFVRNGEPYCETHYKAAKASS